MNYWKPYENIRGKKKKVIVTVRAQQRGAQIIRHKGARSDLVLSDLTIIGKSCSKKVWYQPKWQGYNVMLHKPFQLGKVMAHIIMWNGNPKKYMVA
jgi:hypothetical protein